MFQLEDEAAGVPSPCRILAGRSKIWRGQRCEWRRTPASRFSAEFVRIMDNYPPTNAGMSGKGLAATIHLDDVLSDDDNGEFYACFFIIGVQRS
jgi:hypothetical protein